MSKPLVAIVGRPNVGKSTIINGLAQKRVSIVEDIPGVTRDRIYCDVRWLDRLSSMAVSVCRRMIRRLQECLGVRESPWYSA